MDPSHLRAADPAPGSLQIRWVDVEGGAATLIITPAGESVLVDTGNPGGRDPGRIHRAAREAGLTRIDHLITTHFHMDHFGGAAELSALIPIGTVWDNGLPDTNPDNNPSDTRWPLLSKPYREMKVEARHVIQPGQTLPLKSREGAPPFAIRCVAARQSFIEQQGDAPGNPQCDQHAAKPKDTSDNANSIAIVVELGAFRFFDGGDMTWNTEAALVCPINRVGEVDVYQVNHHGLDQSNNPVLVHSLAPTVSVMNNGTRKGTGAETLAALRSSPGLKAMFQVHKNLRDDTENNTSDERIANLAADCEGHGIQLVVTPDGGHYTVSIPSSGREEMLATRADKWKPTWR